MKILFDYKIFYQQKYGGISNYFCNLGKELIKLNQEILFCTPIHKNQYLNSLEKNNIYGKYVNFLPHYLNFIFENFNHSNTNKIIKSYKPNIIHETYYSTKEYSNKKIICTVYDLINEKFSNYFKNSQQIYEIKKKTLYI